VVLKQRERFEGSETLADSYLSCFIEQAEFGLEHCFFVFAWYLN